MNRFQRVLLLALLAGCTPVRSPDMEFKYPKPAADTAAVQGESPARKPAATRNPAAVITAAGIRRDIAFLASDRLRGRDTPSPGLDTAAAYIAGRFRRLGLRPAGERGGYLQRWPLRRVSLDRDAVRLRFESNGRSTTLRYGVDYVAMPGGGAVDAQAVFLGGADRAPEQLSSLPDTVPLMRLHGSTPEEWRWAIMVHRPTILAGRDSVPALVYVLDADFDASALPRAAAVFEAPVESGAPVPAFFIRYQAAERVLRAAGVDPAVLDAKPSATLPLKQLRIHAMAPARPADVRAPNVAAVLPGADSGRQYVVVSAHFDHLGVGQPDASGDSIYNGADDNASGTAALLAVAAAFRQLPRPPARSVLFLAVSGEEKGLLGSKWFAAHPTVSLQRVVADLNLDMVGRNNPDTVVVIGHDYSSLGPLFDAVAGRHPELHLAIGPDPKPSESFFTRSDQYSFATRGIPSVLVTTFLEPDYHRPSDEVARIDADKVARIARLVFFAAQRVAGGAKPEWTEAGRAAVH